MFPANNIMGVVIQVLMAVTGALARALNQKGRVALMQSLRNLFVAGFTGLMLYFMSQSMDLDSGWLYALSGITGWAGPGVLDWLTIVASKKTGIPLAGGLGNDSATEEHGAETLTTGTAAVITPALPAEVTVVAAAQTAGAPQYVAIVQPAADSQAAVVAQAAAAAPLVAIVQPAVVSQPVVVAASVAVDPPVAAGQPAVVPQPAAAVQPEVVTQATVVPQAIPPPGGTPTNAI
ncbi:hypothetical protein FACS1894184_17020 [Clostridia bacterium]|nr:hypothetical protein FACS1894184_17020 [Clostridia bacterium]